MWVMKLLIDTYLGIWIIGHCSRTGKCHPVVGKPFSVLKFSLNITICTLGRILMEYLIMTFKTVTWECCGRVLMIRKNLITKTGNSLMKATQIFIYFRKREKF